jgi:phage terminase small subunit
MPVLNTLRQEVFARLVSEGRTYTQAALAAGYSRRSASCLGSQLMKQRQICERVSELKRVRPQTTRESVVSALLAEGVFFRSELQSDLKTAAAEGL